MAIRRLRKDKVVEAVSIDKAKAALKDKITQEAWRRIGLQFPIWKVFDTLIEGVELTYIRTVNGSLNTNQQTRLTALQTDWQVIKGIRSASDTKEAEVEALSDINDVKAYDFKTGWPA